MLINKIKVIQAFRTILLDSEIVILTASSEYMGIREGEYDPLIHTRPDAPEIRRIIEPEELAVIERPFDSGNYNLWVREHFIPIIDGKTTAETNRLVGIYELSVFVPSDNGAISEIVSCMDHVRYIQEIFDPIKADIITIQATQTEITIDELNISAGFIDQDIESHYRVPISITFRAYQED